MKMSFNLWFLSFLVLPSMCFSSAVNADKEPIDWEYQIAYQRGIEAVNWAIPAVSMINFREAYFNLGGGFNTVYYLSQPPTPKTETLTANNQTGYATILMTTKNGPVVLDIPPASERAMIFGSAVDIWEVPVADMGPAGSDQGQGGKYLLLPPDYEGDVPEGYFTAKSTSLVNWLILRGFLKDGQPDFSSNLFRTGVRVYPLAEAAAPPKMEFLNGSKKAFNTIHANNFEFYEELHAVLEREPIEMLDPELRGLFASIGIQKGKPFAPDARMKKLLTDAVAVGNASARTLLWYERDKSTFLYENSYWKEGFIGGSYRYLKDKGMGGRNLDARTHFYYNATVNTPAMAWKLVGKELYQLDEDPQETTNLADQYPEKVKEYKVAYDKWWAEISPTFEEKPFFIIGHEAENPMTLYCHDWHTDEFTPWAQRHIRSGYVNNGFWRVKVAEAGTYNLKLRRWPQETGLALNAEAPIRPALEGTSMSASKKGKALNIKKVRLKIQNQELSQVIVDPGVEYVEFEVKLEKGETHLQTWFTLDDGVEIGAYYVEVEKL